MKLYSATDLHSNNHFLTIIDEQDQRILEKRLPNDLAVTLRTLEPYRYSRHCCREHVQLVLAGRWAWKRQGIVCCTGHAHQNDLDIVSPTVRGWIKANREGKPVPIPPTKSPRLSIRLLTKTSTVHD
jgi:hypothetical protein